MVLNPPDPHPSLLSSFFGCIPHLFILQPSSCLYPSLFCRIQSSAVFCLFDRVIFFNNRLIFPFPPFFLTLQLAAVFWYFFLSSVFIILDFFSSLCRQLKLSPPWIKKKNNMITCVCSLYNSFIALFLFILIQHVFAEFAASFQMPPCSSQTGFPSHGYPTAKLISGVNALLEGIWVRETLIHLQTYYTSSWCVKLII